MNENVQAIALCSSIVNDKGYTELKVMMYEELASDASVLKRLFNSIEDKAEGFETGHGFQEERKKKASKKKTQEPIIDPDLEE